MCFMRVVRNKFRNGSRLFVVIFFGYGNPRVRVCPFSMAFKSGLLSGSPSSSTEGSIRKMRAKDVECPAYDRIPAPSGRGSLCSMRSRGIRLKTPSIGSFAQSVVVKKRANCDAKKIF